MLYSNTEVLILVTYISEQMKFIFGALTVKSRNLWFCKIQEYLIEVILFSDVLLHTRHKCSYVTFHSVTTSRS